MISVRNAVRLRRVSLSLFPQTIRNGRVPAPRFPALGLVAAAFLVATVFSCGLASASDRWLTSYETAMETAQETGRPVLTIFTGSDWCPHCRTLEDNVLRPTRFSTGPMAGSCSL